MQDSATDPRALRRVLGCFATGVVVVTGRDPLDGAPAGMTMNSFTAVSLDPALILFCIARSAHSLPAWQRMTHYAVNVLGRGQEEISGRFARPLARKWAGVRHRPGLHGVPLLDGALASLECAAHDRVDGGDHVIFIGRVLRCGCADSGEPLLYFRGGYAVLESAPAWPQAQTDASAQWPLSLHY
jgi:flavin reductase (DIM6/NTAB) family NADH-FMN oxidoreductase RutF